MADLSQILCTGQTPNSAILESLEPGAISKKTKRILVKPTLQIRDSQGACAHIFALGDVADTEGPKMARASLFQAEIVLQNILAMINNRSPTEIYTPNLFVEGAIKLTLGRVGMFH
jgi:NADH dehydrogenase FAD-containing subunit